MRRARGLAATALGVAALAAAAPPASADSISYVKDGDVWLSSGDGARQHRVTTTGGYADASQADDGTIIALTGVRLHRLDRSGTVLADFDTPVSDTRPPGQKAFFGPYEPTISPDGTRVAYSWYYLEFSQNPGCLPPTCVTRDIRQGVGYSHPDRQTGWEELGRMTGWIHPVWLPDGRVMLSTPGRLPNADVVTDDVLDSSTTTWANWFTDYGTRGLAGGDVTRQGTKLAFVAGEGQDSVRIYRSKGSPPEPPEACYAYEKPVGGKAGTPTWSPDGSRLAWAEGDGVRVVSVPDFAAGCTTDGASPTATLLIPGASEPDWGPADLPAGGGAAQAALSAPASGSAAPAHGAAPAPAARPAPAAPAARTGAAARGVTLSGRAARLRSALARGLEVRVSGAPGRRIALVARNGRRVVARGAGRAGANGRTTVRLRFGAAARRRLGRLQRVGLVISGAGARTRVTLRR